MTSTPIDAMRAIPVPAGQRGRADHERRTQILTAANEHFRDYGYSKTTVADLAKAIGMSAAYVYKFFDSKHAIGEAVCAQSLGSVAEELRGIAASPKPAATRLRLIYKTVARRGMELCFNDRRLHDLAVTACAENWQAVRDHQAALQAIVHDLIAEGRRSGEFERKTLIAETCSAVMLTLDLFSRPTMLEHNIDDPEGKAESVVNLVLRSFAP
jgi:AcrR family transcriptional regulator